MLGAQPWLEELAPKVDGLLDSHVTPCQLPLSFQSFKFVGIHDEAWSGGGGLCDLSCAALMWWKGWWWFSGFDDLAAWHRVVTLHVY